MPGRNCELSVSFFVHLFFDRHPAVDILHGLFAERINGKGQFIRELAVFKAVELLINKKFYGLLLQITLKKSIPGSQECGDKGLGKMIKYRTRHFC